MPLARPKLDKDGWPKWMWVLTEEDTAKYGLGWWQKFHFPPKQLTANNLFANHLLAEVRKAGGRWIGDFSDSSDVAISARTWNRAVSAAGYNVPQEYL